MAKNDDKKKSKLPLIIGLFIIVALSAVGGAYLYLSQNTEAKEKVVVETYADLGEIFVNLDEESGKKYVKLSATMTYDSENKELAEELTVKAVALRDSAVFYFKSLGVEDFNTENEAILKEKLVEQLNINLSSGKIIDVKFGQLLIQ